MFDLKKHFAGRTWFFGAAIGLATIAGFVGCRKSSAAQSVSSSSDADPAAVNLAPVDANGQYLDQGAQPNEAQQSQQYQQNPQQYQQPHAPDPDNYTPPQNPNDPNASYAQNGQYAQPSDQ